MCRYVHPSVTFYPSTLTEHRDGGNGVLDFFQSRFLFRDLQDKVVECDGGDDGSDSDGGDIYFIFYEKKFKKKF